VLRTGRGVSVFAQNVSIMVTFCANNYTNCILKHYKNILDGKWWLPVHNMGEDA